ncbi:MAG: outer membrane beta-barrel protein [Hyphomonadaceae bacterium]|nr:outer membrane beta-barrel protein [Hyphomonadaceae bacterium]
MTSTKIMTVVGGALVVTGFSSAVAQQQEGNFFQRDRYEAVMDRYQVDFDPEPVRLGTFLLNSQLGLGAESNDNVFADPANEQDDILFQIAPVADLRSNWSRHELGARAEVTHREYNDLASESATDLRGELRGRLDITRGFDIGGTIFASDEVEPRYSVANLAVFEEPINYQTTGARAVARFTRDRFRARANVEVTDYSYDDVALVGGGTQSLGQRDYSYQRAQGRISYAVTPDIALFGQAEASTREYDELVNVAGMDVSRDADGYALQLGANFELPVLLRGDVAVGYLEDSKDSDVFADVNGLSVDANVQWFPSRLTTVTLDASRRVIDPGLATSGSATAQDYGIRVDHELYRNILLFAEAGQQERDYEDIDRGDELLELRFGATYKMNKRIHVDGYFERFDRDSSVATGNFEQNIFGLALRIHP